MSDKTFDEVIREAQAKLRQEEHDAAERLKEERESALTRSAAVCYEALYERFSAPDLNVESDFNASNDLIMQATSVLKGEVDTTGSPAPAASQTPPISDLPFDFDSLDADTQRIMIMIAKEPRRFKEEEIGDQVVLKDTRYASARAAERRKKDAERAQEQGGDGSSSTSAPPAPVKAVPKPPRSGSTATEVQPPAAAPAEGPAQQSVPEAVTPTPQSEGQAPTGDETPESQASSRPSLMDRAKDAGKSGVTKLLERNPQ